MKKIYLLFVMLTLALGVFAQSKGKNAMTLRLVDIKDVYKRQAVCSQERGGGETYPVGEHSARRCQLYGEPPCAYHFGRGCASPSSGDVYKRQTSGIGQEVAGILVQQGWRIGIAGRREEVLRSMQQANPQQDVYKRQGFHFREFEYQGQECPMR